MQMNVENNVWDFSLLLFTVFSSELRLMTQVTSVDFLESMGLKRKVKGGCFLPTSN